jgi:hypothetical protein
MNATPIADCAPAAANGTGMRLFLFDGIGPFFLGDRRRRVNWSKAPFTELDAADDPLRTVFPRIIEGFRTLAARAAGLGFNAVSLDDLAHLADHASYDDALRRKLDAWREGYRCLFDIAEENGLSVYLTTDAGIATADAPRAPMPRQATVRLRAATTQVFALFPQVRGIILRIGECDAKDVRGIFRSRLCIRTAAEARRMITDLVSVFAAAERLLIVRTWTVGVHHVGDLIWNRDTYDRTFEGLEHPCLAVSMKYGESDFYRFLPLNKLFFRGHCQKIIELQARREYEGAGEFPSFVGWDYERYLRQLQGVRNMIGAWIWIQTGGWSTFRRLTYLRDSSVWNEINAFVTLRLARDGVTTEQAVEAYWRTHRRGDGWCKLLVLLRLSDEVIKELFYIDQLARRKLFFRRVRVPTLLSVFWDLILVNHSLRKFLRCLVEDGEDSVLQGWAALSKIRVMQRLAGELGLPERDMAFMYDTFEILAAAREYYFGTFDPAIVRRIEDLKRAYKAKYRLCRYGVRLDFSPFHFPRWRLRVLLALWLRDRRGYRIMDRILMVQFLSLLSPVFLLTRHRTTAEVVNNRAMGLRKVMK